jgi:MFS family permease
MSRNVGLLAKLRLGSLSHDPDFVKLWVGQTISELGSWLGALPLLAILLLRATPAQMGVLETLLAAPAIFIGLFAGAWVDRRRRRPLLIAADLGRALTLGSLPLLALAGWLNIGTLYGIALVTGSLTVLFEIAHPSYMPTLVQEEQLVEANSKLGASSSLAEIGSPALGGLLVQWIGAPLTVLLDALSFLASALFLGRIRRPEPAPAPPAQRPALGRDIAAGLGLVVRQPLLRAMAGSSATRDFFGGFFGALYGLFVIRTLGLSPAVLGLLVGSGGAGALLGALLVPRLARHFGRGPTLAGAFLVSAALVLLIPLAGGPPLLAAGVLFAGQVLGDLALAVCSILALSLRQQITPSGLLGRVNASVHFLTGGCSTLGVLAGGLIGQFAGVRAAVIIAALGIQLASLWLVFSPIWQVE